MHKNLQYKGKMHTHTHTHTSCKSSLTYLTICEQYMDAVLVAQLFKVVFLKINYSEPLKY